MQVANTENWSVNSAAGPAELLQDAARQAGFSDELFPPLSTRRWDGSEATGWRVSHDYFTLAFRSLRRASEDSALGIRLARNLTPRPFNNLIYLVMSSESLEEGLRRWVRFQPMFSTASRLRLTSHGGTAQLTACLADGALQNTVDQGEYFLALVWRYINWITGGDISASEIHLARENGGSADFEDFFQAPVSFGHGANAIVFDREVLRTPPIHACRSVFATTERLVEREVMAGLPESISAQVRIAMDVLGQGCMPELEEVADHLNVSARTLQRRLADEARTFSQLLDSHCRSLALEALDGGEDLTIEEIAERCGFLETRSFYRAFTRWTGMTPDRYRRRAGASRQLPLGAWGQ